MSSEMPTLFTMTVDAEEEWDWQAGWPTSDLSVSNIRALPKLQNLCSRHGVATTYFANQAVLEDREARGIIRDLARDERVEIGMHIHPWNTPPLSGSPVTARTTFIHNLPERLAWSKLEHVHASFERHGFRPVSFRGGRYSSGAVAQDFLRAKGFLADASVVPYTTWPDEGAPDYRSRDLRPVRLAPRGEGEKALWEIPLTLGFTRRPFGIWARWYDFVGRTRLRSLRLVGIGERVGVVRKAWLNFEDPLGRDMMSFLVGLRRLRLPFISFSIHSSSLVAGKGPYTRTRDDEARVFETLDEVFRSLAGWQEFESATVAEIACSLEEQYARAGN